jgi:hypothetical protein
VRRTRPKDTGDDDVYENYPGIFIQPADLDAMATSLDKERRQVRAWAVIKIKSQMLSRAHALNLEVAGVWVNKCADISKSWEQNRNDANAKKMHQILFGIRVTSALPTKQR